VRLAGEQLSAVCRLDLYGTWCLLTTFETPEVHAERWRCVRIRLRRCLRRRGWHCFTFEALITAHRAVRCGGSTLDDHRRKHADLSYLRGHLSKSESHWTFRRRPGRHRRATRLGSAGGPAASVGRSREPRPGPHDASGRAPAGRPAGTRLMASGASAVRRIPAGPAFPLAGVVILSWNMPGPHGLRLRARRFLLSTIDSCVPIDDRLISYQ
jgi:hypothetical protein